MSYWQDKVALITGGSAGLGRHVAQTLAAAGARLVLCGRNAGRLADTAESLRGLGAEVREEVADVSLAGQTQALVQRVTDHYGQLDLACCCAGLSMRGAVVDTPRDKFQQLWEVNFLAPLEMAQSAGPWLETAGGHLVLIGSLATHTAPQHMGAYPATKHPLAALAQQLRLERGPAGLHTLLVCPGPIAGDHGPNRYAQQTADLPDSAQQPGGGAKVKQIDPNWLAARILRGCQQRTAELVVPRKARWLFALAKLNPSLGDWLLRKNMKGS